MKAPDVIYVEFSEDVNLAFEKQPFEETPAYIRKDALLEWLGGQLETLKSLLDKDPYKEAYIGKCEAFKEVINKLNSM